MTKTKTDDSASAESAKSDPKPRKRAKPAASSEKRSPMAWARELDHIRTVRVISGDKIKATDWMHRAADALHGWSQHRHDAQEPMLLSREDYIAAIDAACGAPPVKPHPGARSPYSKIPSKED